MFAGMQHVWRTTDWGGDPATLDAKCRNVDPLGFFPSDAEAATGRRSAPT